MRDSLKTLLAAREEVVELAGEKLVVRELTSAADTAGLKNGEDSLYSLAVRSVFEADGTTPVFTDDDVAALKAASLVKLADLFRAVRRVNGFDLEGDVKNSRGEPSSA